MTGARVVVASLVALVVALGLSACTDEDPEPKFAPPSESPTPSEPRTSEVSALDPVETVRAWVAAYNTALLSGDVSELKQLSYDPCTTCEGFIGPITRVHDAGGHFETEGWTVDGSNVRNSGPATAAVDVAVTIAGGETAESQDAKPVVYETEKHLMRFRLKHDGAAWAVTFIGFIS